MNRLSTAGLVALAGMSLLGCGGAAETEQIDASGQAVDLTTVRATTGLLDPKLPDPTLSPRLPLLKNPPSRGTEDQGEAAMAAHMAALGTATIDCLGTTDSRVYAVDRSGKLARTFKECRNGDRELLQHIDNLLGIQVFKEAPGAARYLSGTWQAWQKEFEASGIKSCPSWKKVETINPPDKETVPSYSRDLPKLPVPDGRVRPAAGKENYLYAVGYPSPPPKQGCSSDAECAAACAGGYGPSMILEVDRERGTLLLDPTWWLVNTAYEKDANPFLLTPGYYHTMSFYGPEPGAKFGAINRADEPCSMFHDGYHFLSKLQRVECSPGWVCMTMCK